MRYSNGIVMLYRNASAENTISEICINEKTLNNDGGKKLEGSMKRMPLLSGYKPHENNGDLKN